MLKDDYSACTSIIIGKKASVDGSIMIGRNEDSKASWPKNFTVHEHKTFDEPQKFVSKDTGFSIELPAERMKYSATPEWTDKFGLFEEDGFNEDNVAMSATESTYANERVLSCDPLVEKGIAEEAMITVVLPYVHSAREGVQRLGDFIQKYGSSETNGILFADTNEAWYFENGSGHHWVAVKVPDDAYAVIANQTAIQKIDFNDPDNYMWSDGIQAFVEENHLNPLRNGEFNFRMIFGTRTQSDTYYNTPRVWYGQKMFNPEIEQDPQSQDMPIFRKANRLLSIEDAQDFLASHFQETPYDPIGSGSPKDKTKFRPISLAKTQESHVLQIRPNMPKEIAGIHWLAMGVAAQSTYVPFFSSIDHTPNDYHQSGIDYSDKSAYWVFKLVGVLLDPHYLELGPDVQKVQQQLRIKYGNAIQKIDQNATHLSNTELKSAAQQTSNELANLALSQYRQLANHLISASTDFSKLNYQQDLNL